MQSKSGESLAKNASIDWTDNLKIITRNPATILAIIPMGAMLFGAGALAGAIGKTVTAPLDRLKLLLQTQGGLQTGMIQQAAKQGNMIKAFTAIGREEGLLGYWKGNIPQVIRVIPYSAAQLGSYELFKSAYSDENGNLSMPRRLAAGASAGMFSMMITYPLDTIRLRIAVDPSVRGMGTAVAKLAKEGGGRAFYRGLASSCLSIAPYMALELTSFDLLPKEIPSVARGFIAAMVATTCCYPLDTVRRQIQIQAGAAVAISSAVSRIYTQEGVKGFYRGFVPSAVKNLPNKSIRLSTFENVKSWRYKSEQMYSQEVDKQKQLKNIPK